MFTHTLSGRESLKLNLAKQGDDFLEVTTNMD